MAEEQFQNLKGRLTVQLSEDIGVLITGGWVSIIHKDYDSVSISEKEFRDLVQIWTNAHLAQKNAENEPGITSGDYE